MTRSHLLTTTLLFVCAGLAPAAAQDTAILSQSGPFEAIPGVFDLSQTSDENVAGVAQTSDLPNATVNQNGFYNRTAIVQTGIDPIATVGQTGDYNRVLVLQSSGFTDALTDQLGDYNSAFIVQTGTDNLADVRQNGETNGAFVFQFRDFAVNNATVTQNGVVDSLVTPGVSPGGGVGIFDPFLTQDGIETLVTNFLYAPESVSAPAEVTELGGVAFIDSIMARTTDRAGTCDAADDLKAPTLDCDRFQVFTKLDYTDGSQDDRMGALGFDHDTKGVIVGAEMPFTPEFVGGVALRYARTDADVAGGFSDIEVDSYGGTVYGDFRRAGFFVSGMGFYLRDEYNIVRDGFLGENTAADTDGETFGGAVRAGYLYDFGALEAGPIVGYSHARAKADGYDESGNPLLAQTEVGDQTAESRLGLVGGRIAFAHLGTDMAVRGTLDVAYERDFGDDGFEAQRTEFAGAPGVGVWTPVDALGDLDYVSVGGNATMDFAHRISVDLSAGGRWSEERESYRLGAELRKGF